MHFVRKLCNIIHFAEWMPPLHLYLVQHGHYEATFTQPRSTYMEGAFPMVHNDDCETCDFECVSSDSRTSPRVDSTLSRNIAEIQIQMGRPSDSETHLSSWTFNFTKLSVPNIKMHH